MQPHNLQSLLQSTPDFQTDRDGAASFWMPAPFNDGHFWLGRYTGRSPWERHPTTDELLHCLEGEVEITLLTEAGPVSSTLTAGSVFIVPKGIWHQLHAAEEVVQCGVTPGPTEHSEKQPAPGD